MRTIAKRKPSTPTWVGVSRYSTLCAARIRWYGPRYALKSSAPRAKVAVGGAKGSQGFVL